MIITIDGPTASGKSTVARLLAQRLGFFYLSSGLLFRGLAYCLKRECNYDDARMANLTEQDIATCIKDTSVLTYKADEQGERVFLRGIDVTAHLKTPEIDSYSSIIGTSAAVREALVSLQRLLAEGLDVIAEGRDAGSVVFPQANNKVYLTASVAVRGRRWQKDQARRGFVYSEEDAIAAIEARDKRDSERKIAPLIIPKGAIVVDNSAMNVEQTVEYLLSKLGNPHLQ